MSGPKSYSYQVDEALVRQRQEEARLQVRARALERETAELAARIAAAAGRHAGISSAPRLPGLRRAGDHSARRREQDERAAELGRLARRLDDEVRRVRQGALIEALGSLGRGSAEGRSSRYDAPAARSARPAPGPSAEEELASRRATIERVMGRIPEGADEAIVADLETEALAALADPDARQAEQRIAAMRLTIDQERDRQRAVQRFETSRSAWRERLDPVDPTCAAALATLAAATPTADGMLPPGLEEMLEQAESAAAADATRRCAAEALEQAFAELGYDVGSAFDSVLLDQGFADVRRAEWPGYAVRIRLGTGEPELRVNVVRGAADARQERRDVEVETEWCAAVPELLTHMASLGVQAQLTSALDPGARAVQVVEDLAARPQRASRARVIEPRTMEAP
jgi:hypothetical protein